MAPLITQAKRTLAFAIIGLTLRIVATPYLKDTSRQRVEISTPISDWKRAYEAVHLFNSGLNPYSGNIFHEYPISLQFYKVIIAYFNTDLVFALTDVIIALLLQYSVYNQLIASDHSIETATSRSNYVLTAHLFSPLNIIACAGASTSIFTNFLIAVIYLALHYEPFKALTWVLCAFLTCNNIHYATLVLPVFIAQEFCSRNRKKSNKPGSASRVYYQDPDFYASLTTSGIVYLISVVTLLSTSYLLVGKSWSYMRATYLFVLKTQDLTPNIGMFWYFFTEVFEHFLEFFTWVMQINAFIHVVPLSIGFRDKPFFTMFITTLTSTIFQPYPSLVNVGLIFSLLPQWTDLFSHVKNGLLVSCTAITCVSLWPIFWHLWIVIGTANANFYFGATLAFSLSLIMLLMDLMNAQTYASAKSKLDEHKIEAVKLLRSKMSPTN